MAKHDTNNNKRAEMKNLVTGLLETGLTRKELAKLLSINPSTLGDYARGKSMGTDDLRAKMANLLKERTKKEAKKKEAKKNEVKEEAPKKEGKKKKEARVTVASFTRDLILKGLTNHEVWTKLQAEFGLDDRKKHYPSWYRCEMRRKGLLPAELDQKATAVGEEF